MRTSRSLFVNEVYLDNIFIYERLHSLSIFRLSLEKLLHIYMFWGKTSLFDIAKFLGFKGAIFPRSFQVAYIYIYLFIYIYTTHAYKYIYNIYIQILATICGLSNSNESAHYIYLYITRLYWACAAESCSILRKAAQRLCRKCNISLVSNDRPGKHLEYSHPKMQFVRDYVALQVSQAKINAKLIANFDQVWSLNFRPRKKTLQQRPNSDELSRSPSMRKIRHCFERVLNRPITESLSKHDDLVGMDDFDSHLYLPGTEVQGGVAAHVPVESYRIPHTLTTLSWSTGDVSRGFVTVNEDHLTETARERLNEASKKKHCRPPTEMCLFYRTVP